MTGRTGAVQVHHVWKRFRADHGASGYGAAELRRLASALRRDPSSGWRWVLRDITFDVEPGETVGFVGVNGSGKSTLLKLVAGTMHPYAGRISAHGRIAALMDVQAGIQPELTGRENVLLYGRLLGFGRRAVQARVDEILHFADLEDAAERQVAHYSSGMGVRLGFSIAAHLEPDVLIVDEALAVGDARFRQKCLRRMREVVDGGATLLFVSHGLELMTGMCRRALWLSDGVVRADGPASEVAAAYRRTAVLDASRDADGDVTLVGHLRSGTEARSGEPLEVDVHIATEERRAGSLTVGVTQGEADPVFTVTHPVDLAPGTTTVRVRLDRLPMPKGQYAVWATVTDPDGHALCPWQAVAKFRAQGPELPAAPTGVARLAPVWVPSTSEVVAEGVDPAGVRPPADPEPSTAADEGPDRSTTTPSPASSG
jgi:ABC-2 type transport system ATP-binding protein